MEWVDYGLGRWAFIQVLQYIAVLATAFTIVWSGYTYITGADERAQQSYNQAWQAINSAEGQGGSGGRIGAMQGLNEAGQSLRGVTAEDAVLARIDLHGGDLTSANFQGSSLEGANLREVDLRNANLQRAYLGEYSGREETIQTDLRGAHLEEADARDADLTSADLSGASLNEADLSDADLDEAKLQGAKLKGTVLEGTSLIGANLQGADLENAELWNADISGANLKDAKHLTQSELEGAIGDWETQLPEGEGLQRPSWWYQGSSGELRWQGPLQPGEHWTTAFDVPLSLTLGEGWETLGTESITSIAINRRDTGLGVIFVAPEEVYDPHGLSSAEVMPFPKDMGAWLRSHPYLIAGKTAETAIGGVAATQFDVEIPAMPEDYPDDLCEDSCLPLFAEQGGGAIRADEGEYRFVVVEVLGEVVVVFYDLEQGTPGKVEEVLKTVKWGWLSSPDGTINAGRYATREFEPALSFNISDDWRLAAAPETTDELSIESPEGGYLIFTSPSHVYDPSNPSEPKEVPAPKNTDEWVAWFQGHPKNLDTSEPVPMSVGGASAKRIDVTASSTPENYSRDVCGEQSCVPLYKGSTSESTIVSYEGWKDRFVIVDVGGETVIIDVAAPTDKFDEFLSKAQKVLDTVEWRGG
jgi:uncharacterized protein YjbI with pentapeptide repeats